MELLKPKENLRYEIESGGAKVTFLVRGSATVRDKLQLDLIGEYENGKFKMDRAAFFEKIVELFVTGWEGVTEDGKPVPYSFETMMTRLPYDTTQDWMLKLGTFITEKLGLFVVDDSKKNG